MMNANTCHNNGWSAISSGKSIGKFGDVRYIRCAHGKARERSKSHKGLESSSTRPDLDERCRCVIPIQFDNKHERFFIRQNGGACLRHNDHFKTPKERSELCKRDLSDDLVDDITEKLKRNIPKDVLRELVEYETGRTLSASVISHLKKTMVVDEFKGGDASLSAGAATLKWLEEKPNVQFVAYFGRLEDAGDTVRVRKKVRRRRQCTSTTNCKGKASAKSAESDKGGTSSLDLTEDTGSIDISDDAKSFVKHVIKELTVGSQVLLAVAWVTDDARLYHSRFPGVLGMDVTFGVSAEQRPLFRVSGKTSNNKNIPHFNAFIPSQQRFTFDWLIMDGLPDLLDKNALKKTSIILTDQDAQLVGSLLQNLNMSANCTYGNARNRLCKWHKVDRGYIGATDCLAKKPREKDFQSKIVNWLYSFTNDIETEEQEKDSLEQLSMFIDVSEEEGVNRSLVTATRKFIRESFKPYLPLLCQRHFNDIYCGNVNENCFTESDNASMKKDSMGPEANSQLHISTSAIVGHTERRTGKLEREALKEARKSRQGKASDNEVLKCKTDISKKIVFQKCDDICDQFDLSSDYSYQVVQEDKSQLVCLVRKPITEVNTKATSCPIPRYSRTRQLIFREVVVDERWS